MLLEINDFPSFGGIPRAVATVSEYVLHAAKRAERERDEKVERRQRYLAAKANIK